MLDLEVLSLKFVVLINIVVIALHMNFVLLQIHGNSIGIYLGNRLLSVYVVQSLHMFQIIIYSRSLKIKNLWKKNFRKLTLETERFSE